MEFIEGSANPTYNFYIFINEAFGNSPRLEKLKSASYIHDFDAVKTLQTNEIACFYSLSLQEQLMREQLLKWLIAKCKLTLELRVITIQHCIRLFDLYINKRGAFMLTLDQAQLHLLTCLFISCKYQQIYPPSVSDFEYVSKYKFLAKDFIMLQYLILKQIDYRLNFPLASDWLFALSGKNLPQWVLICFPTLTPGYSIKKLAEQVIHIKIDQEDNSQFMEDQKNAEKLMTMLSKKY